MRYSRHLHAPYYLSLLSFVESFILPFPPPDVMLAPMSLSRPSLAMRFAMLTLFFSVLGGLVGYLIGAFLFDQVEPYIIEWGYQARFETVTIWRGARFFLLAWCLARFGPAIEPRLVRYIEYIGWAIVVILLLAIGFYYLTQ
jgi:membrane protein YqaA with SNARE-associated domain